MKANFSMNYSSIIQDNSEREDVYEDARIGVYADVCILYQHILKSKSKYCSHKLYGVN